MIYVFTDDIDPLAFYNHDFWPTFYDYPRGDFFFIEEGQYGLSPAWQEMRRLYGFTDEERLELEHSLYQRFGPGTRVNTVNGRTLIINDYPYYERTDEQTVYDGPTVFCAHDQDSPYVPESIELAAWRNENAVYVADVGHCSVCDRMYYRLVI